MVTGQEYLTALNDFRRARNRAKIEMLLSQLSGVSNELLSYDEVRKSLRLGGGTLRGLQDIPLDAIVGSVGRYNDFTRAFLPRQDSNEERWVRVQAAASDLRGLPPIDVYQIGEVYFVKDGNHRVSVARQMGSSHIQAYVTYVNSRVPLSPDIQPDDLIRKAEFNSFLEHTRLDEMRPDSDLSVSLPGQYQFILEHIDVHRYFMGIEQHHEIPYDQAVADWYDVVYLPVVKIIRALGILKNFPNRTETDLYVWIITHHAHLESEIAWEIQPEFAASDFVEHFGEKDHGLINKIGTKILDIVIPESLDRGPPPGQWRRQAVSARSHDCLFMNALVPINGHHEGWIAVDQSIKLATREQTALNGLYVLATEEEIVSDTSKEVKNEFQNRCEYAGLQGDLLVTSGKVSQQVCNNAIWNDIIILNLAHPPGKEPLARLSSGIRELIQRCPRPILATPNRISELNHALLAFDGSAKAYEGLYIASYLAGKWRINLDVITVADQDARAHESIDVARAYLDDQGLTANYLIRSGPIAAAILETADVSGCDFIILGGYGLSPVLEIVFGSTLDQILRQSTMPILISR